MELSGDEDEADTSLEEAWNNSMLSLRVTEPEEVSITPDEDLCAPNVHLSFDESIQEGNVASKLFSRAEQSFDVDALTSLCDDINNMDLLDMSENHGENDYSEESIIADTAFDDTGSGSPGAADMKIRLAHAESAYEDLQDAYNRLECAFRDQASKLKRLESDLLASNRAIEQLEVERDTAIGHTYIMQHELLVTVLPFWGNSTILRPVPFSDLNFI